MVLLLVLATGCGRHAVIAVEPSEDLSQRLASAPDRATVRLGAGKYHFDGPGIKGKSLNIIGAGLDKTLVQPTTDGGARFSARLYSALQDLTVTSVTVERGQLTLVAVRVDGGGIAVTGLSGSR